jgi:hypothetical protein
MMEQYAPLKKELKITDFWDIARCTLISLTMEDAVRTSEEIIEDDRFLGYCALYTNLPDDGAICTAEE